MPKIHVLHENPDWLPPLAAALDRTGAPWDEWFLVEHAFDLSTPPPEGIFYNRMSASSHTRGHRFSTELTAAQLSWLPPYGQIGSASGRERVGQDVEVWVVAGARRK